MIWSNAKKFNQVLKQKVGLLFCLFLIDYTPCGGKSWVIHNGFLVPFNTFFIISWYKHFQFIKKHTIKIDCLMFHLRTFVVSVLRSKVSSGSSWTRSVCFRDRVSLAKNKCKYVSLVKLYCSNSDLHRNNAVRSQNTPACITLRMLHSSLTSF